MDAMFNYSDIVLNVLIIKVTKHYRSEIFRKIDIVIRYIFIFTFK